MSVTVLYTTAARVTGGRDGRSATLDGTFDVSLTKPKELGGPGGDGANPEKLFAAGYAACFLGAMKFVAGQQQPSLHDRLRVTCREMHVDPPSDGMTPFVRRAQWPFRAR